MVQNKNKWTPPFAACKEGGGGSEAPPFAASLVRKEGGGRFTSPPWGMMFTNGRTIHLCQSTPQGPHTTLNLGVEGGRVSCHDSFWDGCFFLKNRGDNFWEAMFREDNKHTKINTALPMAVRQHLPIVHSSY